MPGWKLHLKIAQELMNIKPIKEFNQHSFLIGNIAPDIEVGWVVSNPIYKKSSSITHYRNKSMKGQALSDFELFLNKNSKYLTNPACFGYYTHLLTDSYWNQIVNEKCFQYNENSEVIGIQTKQGILYGDIYFCNTIKQKDFKSYQDSIESVLLPNSAHIDQESYYLLYKNYQIPMEDIIKAEQFISENYNKIPLIKDTILFSKKEYDIIFENTISTISDLIKKIA